jgi:hypothetical protein
MMSAGYPRHFDLEDPVVARLMEIRSRRLGVEFKRTDAPHATRSMHLAITDTRLDELWVVYPGTRTYALDDRILVRPLSDRLRKGNNSTRT